MKRFVIAFLSIFMTLSCFSRSNMFLDIPYNVDIDTFIGRMANNGFSILPDECIEGEAYFFTGQFLNEDVGVIAYCHPQDEIIFTIIVDFYTYSVPANGSRTALDRLYSKFNYLKYWLNSKYYNSTLTRVEESSGDGVEKIYNLVHIVEKWSKNVCITINDKGKRSLVMSFHDDKLINSYLWGY